MKKVLALVLAVMMMATVAFAVDTTTTATPGAKLTITLDEAEKAAPLMKGASVEAGEALSGTGDGDVWLDTKEITAKNFSISNVRWTKGGNLVKSVTINSDDEIVIELKQDYTKVLNASKKTPIQGSFRVNQKGTGKYVTITLNSEKGISDVGYTPGTITLSKSSEAVWDPAGAITDKTVYKVASAAADGASYGTVYFADELGNDLSVRMYKDEKFYLGNSTSPNLDVVKANADSDADMRFVSFVAKPSFSGTVTYNIYAAEDEFVYSIGSNNKLTKAGKWSEDDGCWQIKTRTLGSYVISDKALKSVAAAEETPDNPDTGANDIVGIATALAAVALVSAAAVSLKK